MDKHRHSEQPLYYTKEEKIKAREQIVLAYRDLTGNYKIPEDKNYWTLCNEQPDIEGSEINQLAKIGLIKKSQFYGVDYDIQNSGIIERNRKTHPEAHWFKGEWLRVLDDNYDRFNPALIYFDYTFTVVSPKTYRNLAGTMNICPPDTVIAANIMISDGHSNRKYSVDDFVNRIWRNVVYASKWKLLDKYYPYKASHTKMATFIFRRIL